MTELKMRLAELREEMTGQECYKNYMACLEKIKGDEELYRLLNHFRRENVELHYHDGSLKEEAILERTYSKLLMNEDVREFLYWEEKTLSMVRMIHESIDGSLKLDFDFI